MPNMSYCRFENTYNDLQDCLEHIKDETPSKDEAYYKKLLIGLCKQIIQASK
jgi:hypothetical protein